MSQQYKRTILAILASAGTVIGLAACGGMSGEAATTQPTGTNALPTATTSSSAPAAEESTPAAEPTDDPTPEDVTLKFGKAFTWENGVSATVSAPKTYRSTDTGMGGDKFKYAVQFTVVIVNKSGKVFDPTGANANVQSGDVDGDEIFDSANGINGSPDTKVLNGRQVKYKVAFGVANPKDIVFEFAPGYEYSSQIWTK